MTPQYAAIIGLFCTCFLCLKPQLHAQDDDQTGVKLFRLATTNLYGTGIHVAQAEAEASTNPPAFEVNPANVGSPAGIFKYLSANGTATSYPNTVGTNSGHAERVAPPLGGRRRQLATVEPRLDRGLLSGGQVLVNDANSALLCNGNG